MPVNPWASKTMCMWIVTLGDKRWVRIWTGEGKVRKERPYMVAEAGKVLESCHITRITRKVNPPRPHWFYQGFYTHFTPLQCDEFHTIE